MSFKDTFIIQLIYILSRYFLFFSVLLLKLCISIRHSIIILERGASMNTIRELRKSKGLTQTELGLILNVQKAAISKYELNRATPSSDILKKLSDYFGVSIDYILGANFHRAEEQKHSTDLINLLNQSEVIFNGTTYKLNDDDRQKAITALELVFEDAKIAAKKPSRK